MHCSSFYSAYLDLQVRACDYQDFALILFVCFHPPPTQPHQAKQNKTKNYLFWDLQEEGKNEYWLGNQYNLFSKALVIQSINMC